jgi:Na+-translocating ferredoxin:NAD+ oxidoreductase subunit G
LIVSAFLFGLLIAVADAAWSGKAAENQKNKLGNLMKKLVTNAAKFEVAIKDANVADGKGKPIKTDIYKAVDGNEKTLGFAYITSGTGFADKIELIIAVDESCGKFLGFEILYANETPGFGDKIKKDEFRNQFKNAPAGVVSLIKAGDRGKIDNEIVAITGATVTSTAVTNIFNKSIVSVKEVLQQKGLIK